MAATGEGCILLFIIMPADLSTAEATGRKQVNPHYSKEKERKEKIWRKEGGDYEVV